MLLFTALVFVTVSFAAAGLFFLLAPSRTEQRLRTINADPGAGAVGWTETAASIATPFAKLSAPEGDWETSALRLKLLNAGLRHPDMKLIYFGAKTLLPLLFALLALPALRGTESAQGMTLLFYILVAALVGCYLPNALLAWASSQRQREIFENFPDAADLMLVCVESGMGLDAAMAKVAEEMRRKSLPLAEELHLTNLELRAGASRERSLRNLALRTGVEEVSTFATMLTQADKFGTSVADSLRVFSDDLRHKRQMRAEESAAKIPTKMLFPLVLFIFPSIVMVVLGPAIIQIVRTVLPLINGR